MSWSVIAQPIGSWSRTIDGDTIWDDGLTVWDVSSNIPTTYWDVVVSDPWSDVPAATGTWSPV